MREVIIKSLILFRKTSVEKLVSKKGEKYLEKRYPGFNREKYFEDLLNAKEKSRLRIKKLEEKEIFTKRFIEAIRYSFEHVFMNIADDVALYDDTEFYDEHIKKFKRFKEIYLELYPNTNFGFDALLNGQTPYGDDYVKM